MKTIFSQSSTIVILRISNIQNKKQDRTARVAIQTKPGCRRGAR